MLDIARFDNICSSVRCRYAVIVHPMKSRSWCSVGRTKKVICGIWIASVLLSAPQLHIMVSQSLANCLSVCLSVCHMDRATDGWTCGTRRCPSYRDQSTADVTNKLSLFSRLVILSNYTRILLLPPLRRSCFHLCLSVCLLTGLLKNYGSIFCEILRNGWK